MYKVVFVICLLAIGPSVSVAICKYKFNEDAIRLIEYSYKAGVYDARLHMVDDITTARKSCGHFILCVDLDDNKCVRVEPVCGIINP